MSCCYNCDKRTITCHSTCKQYAEFKKEREKILKENYIKTEADTIEYRRKIRLLKAYLWNKDNR